VLTFFGVIHSASPDGVMYLPWTLDGFVQKIPYQFAVAYVAFGVMLLLISYTKESREPLPDHEYSCLEGLNLAQEGLSKRETERRQQ
jgi:hypothetical protein